jgi:hypothetical protein
VTIAAAESNEPEEGVARATNAVIYRVLLFYVVSVFFVACIVPWSTPFTEDVIKSPFTLAFERIGIPGSGTVMNFVVLTAVLSVLNSSLHTTSRMLFALTRHNDAPQFFLNTTARGVPIWAILAGTSIGYVSVVIYYFAPSSVFTWLINASGAVAIYGIDYVWCPRCVFVECDCGERLVLSTSLTTCGCGADHAALVREELASRRPSKEVSHPLEDEYREWRNKHDEFLHSEFYDWVEWRALEQQERENTDKGILAFWQTDHVVCGALRYHGGHLTTSFQLTRGTSRMWARSLGKIRTFCGAFA